MKSKARSYKDDYAALLNWIKKDGVQEKTLTYAEIHRDDDEDYASPEEVAATMAAIASKRFRKQGATV